MKLRTLCFSLVGLAFATSLTRGARAQSFPADDRWAPLPCGKSVMFDARRDQSGAIDERDIVGDDLAPLVVGRGLLAQVQHGVEGHRGAVQVAGHQPVVRASLVQPVELPLAEETGSPRHGGDGQCEQQPPPAEQEPHACEVSRDPHT